MILRCIIIDDEQKSIDALEILIKRYTGDVKLIAKTTSATEAVELIENYLPEIVFLDINMPEMNGFEMLEKLTWKNFNLVFITAHQEHALRALKNNAMDFLLKPIDYEDLEFTIKKIKDKIARNQDRIGQLDYTKLLSDLNLSKNKILVHLKTGVESVDLQEVICFEARSNYTRIFLMNGKDILTTKTLKDFETQLCSEKSDFMRVHNSYIINLKKVTRLLKVSDEIIMQNNEKIPLSKSRKDDFYDWMNI